mgnify:CR=1 FL=1
MAGDISNRALAILLVATIVVSLGGTMLSLSRLESAGIGGLTGHATDTNEGSVEATVTSTTAINFTTTTVSFGTGTVDPSCNNCTMSTPSVSDATCCNSLAAPASGLVIENVGNENVTLDLNFSEDAAGYIGGTSPLFQMNVTEGEAGSCNNATGGAGSGLVSTWNHTWGNVPTTESEVCNIFQPGYSNDQLKIDVKVRIPDNSKTGLRNATVTAKATTA